MRSERLPAHLLYWVTVQAVKASLYPGEDDHRALMNAARALWDIEGRNSFMFTTELAALLRETDLKNVPASAVRIPYDAVWLELPGIYAGGDTAGLHVTRCVMTSQECVLTSREDTDLLSHPLHPKTVQVCHSVDGERVSLGGVGEAPPLTSFDVAGDLAQERPQKGFSRLPLLEFLEEATGHTLPRVESIVLTMERRRLHEGRRQVHTSYMILPLIEGYTVEECIEIVSEWACVVHPERGDHAGSTRGAKIRAVWDGAIEAAVNALLYLSSPRADLSPLPPQPSAKGVSQIRKQAIRRSRNRTVTVGLRYTPASPKKEKAGRKDSSESGRHNRLHRVRGHWRMQPFGDGRLQTRAVWIEPHWRGKGGVGESPRAAYTSTRHGG
jgi:hypothetical protein